MSHDGFTSVPDPPVNEVPAQMTTEIAWRNSEASLSIPDVFLYTTGIEIAILCRTKDVKPAVTPETVTADFQSMRTWRKRLGQLKVNGAAIGVRTRLSSSVNKVLPHARGAHSCRTRSTGQRTLCDSNLTGQSLNPLFILCLTPAVIRTSSHCSA
jgi:hypothetical protein